VLWESKGIFFNTTEILNRNAFTLKGGIQVKFKIISKLKMIEFNSINEFELINPEETSLWLSSVNSYKKRR
jgi:hypothetical protein